MALAEGAGYGSREGCLSFLSAVAEAASAADFGHGELWLNLHRALSTMGNNPVRLMPFPASQLSTKFSPHAQNKWLIS